MVVEAEVKGSIKYPRCDSGSLYEAGGNRDEEALGFRHQELVHTITEVKQRRVLGILRDDRIATLKKFLTDIPADKVKKVCIDMKESLRKAVEAIFPLPGYWLTGSM